MGDAEGYAAATSPAAGAGDPASTPRQGTGRPPASAPDDDAPTPRGVRWLAASSPRDWDSLARDGGPDYRIADCGSPESHERRLRALLRLPIADGDTLLEFGCGTGRLADLVPRGVRYAGVDWSAGVITLARRRRPDVSFSRGSVGDLTPHDWVVASGPFNYAQGWSKDQTAAAVSAMWLASRRGIAVTVLRTPAGGRLHYDGGELVRFLAGCDWSHLELDRSYLPNDICLRAWRQP